MGEGGPRPAPPDQFKTEQARSEWRGYMINLRVPIGCHQLFQTKTIEAMEL